MRNDCRTLSITDVAARLGRSRSWMYANLVKLRRLGFPDSLPVINRYAAISIDAWIERQGRVLAAATAHVDKVDFDALFNF